MKKLIIFVPLFLGLLLLQKQVLCMYVLDDCVVDERPGSCIFLLECKTLIAEIENAGKPMPAYMTRRLQKLTCGFEGKEPLVCCASSGYTGTISPFEFSSIHGIETPNRGKPASHVDRNENRPNISDNDDTNNNNNIDDGPPDVQNHPNLGLLPTTDCGNIEDDKIVGGNRTRLFQMPWMVILSYNSGRGIEFNCGGTLINKWYVLTAAHCVSFLGRLQLKGVILGEHDVTRDPDCETIEGVEFCASKIRNVTTDTIISHPGYSPQTPVDDIALIRLSEPADFTLDSMKPICLPISSELQREDLAGQNGIVAGWGITEFEIRSPVLLSVAVPIFKNDDCFKAYKRSKQISKKQMCAGGIKDQDSCTGDSGGPIMYPGNMGFSGVRYVQRGIVSQGSTICAIGGYPGIYTRIEYYMDWILNNMRA